MSIYSEVLRNVKIMFHKITLHFSCAGRGESGAVGLPTALHLVIVCIIS